MSSLFLAAGLAAAALLAETPVKAAPHPTPAPDVARATRAWHQERLARLTAEDGWLTLVGLAWLEAGENAAGSAEGLPVPLPPGAPARLGTFTLKGEEVRFTPAPGVAVTLGGKPFGGGRVRTDAEAGGPDVLRHGSLQLLAIRRGERTGIRVRDSEAPARKHFQGIPTWPADARWRVEARLERAEGRTLQVPNVLGTVEALPSPGTLVFTLEGRELRLDPVLEGDQLFLIFGDATNRTDSYGAGRFLYAPVPGPDGRTVLDFNRAYNPPCAFSRYATCPLPPRQNRLPLRIEAGEKRVGEH